jgi:acyl-CoA reductase-like NAD-dependent aldehyde dehydrogenase
MATDVQVALRKIASINPSTGEVLREMECASDADVRQAVARAHVAQKAWAAVSVGKRTEILRNFQQVLHERKTEVARLIAREAGKPYIEAMLTEVMVVLDATRFLIENARSFLREHPLPHGSLAMKTKAGHILREPRGVIGIVSPWNYPLSIPAVETLAAIVTGNAVVLKPSEFTSLVGLEFESLLRMAGVPEGVFQVVVGDGPTGAALLQSEIDKLVFTGSVPTGKKIAAAAAARLLPVLLELGGKDPMVVLDDADLDVASSAAVWGAFMNAGQTCLSVERCYVHRSLYDSFLHACAEKTRKLRVGDGQNPETDVGPMIHERQLRVVESQVEEAKALGARVMTGGTRLPDLGPNFYAPTILADVTHRMQIMREETFGPVLPVVPFDSEADAIALANDSEFGLAASVWTRNSERGEAMARKLVAGTVMVNDVISCFGISEAPHGGVKGSGIGRAHGRHGMEEMVRIKYLDVDRMPRVKKLWWYGYGPSFARHMEGFVDFQFARGTGRRLRGALQSIGLIRDPKM